MSNGCVHKCEIKRKNWMKHTQMWLKKEEEKSIFKQRSSYIMFCKKSVKKEERRWGQLNAPLRKGMGTRSDTNENKTEVKEEKHFIIR